MIFKTKKSETIYEAEKVQLKFPSEHRLNGKHKDGEVIITHKSKEGNMLVVSIFLQIGDPLRLV